jgi:transcriptional regulator GlxA family with amidase domain
MNSKLKQILNWSELAGHANWSVAALAKLCEVSEDTLRRHFCQHMKKTPKTWLAEQRQHQAIGLLHDGFTIKEITSRLGYKQQTNFTRKFKEFWGACPTAPRRVNLIASQKLEND